MKFDGWFEDGGKSLKLSLLEGEEIVGFCTHESHLYLKTNLDRFFKSTDVGVEYLDFVEVPS